MSTYVALLRGINVGGNKKVEMSRLKSCFEEMGFLNVFTHINSGNVMFDSENDDFLRIEGTLREVLGFEIATIFRSRENIENLAKKIPEAWQNDEDQKTDILFLWDEYDTPESIKLIKINPEVDRLIYIEGAIVWNISKSDYKKSGMGQFIKSKLYKNMTARNVNTVRKLRELMKK